MGGRGCHLGWCGMIVVVGGCMPEVGVPEGASIRCDNSKQCPPGLFCQPTLGLCIEPEAEDSTAPALAGAVELTPERAGPGAEVRLGFEVSEALGRPPVVLIDPGGVALALELDGAGSGGLAYSFRRAVTGDEPEATLAVTIQLVDRLGNSAEVTAGEVTFDFSPPGVSGLAFESPAGVVGSGATVAFTAEVETPASLEGATLYDEAGTPLGGVAAALLPTLDPALLALDGLVALGSYELTGAAVAVEVTLVDDVGNRASVRSELLAVDALAPDTAFTAQPGSSTSIDATIAFVAPAGDAAGFECRLDGGAWAACSSPVELTDLEPGAHELAVRARDAAGNVDASPAAAAWTVERRWTRIEVGMFTTCGLTTDERLFCWGSNSYGLLGRGASFIAPASGTPGLVKGRFRDVAIGEAHACAVGRDGSMWCWGFGQFGRLGIGPSSNTLIKEEPVRVGEASDWIEVTAGQQHTCGIRDDGTERTLWCWGYNGTSQLGLDYSVVTMRELPTRIGDGTDWLALAADYKNTCGLLGAPAAPALYCWGDNSGQRAGQSVGFAVLAPTPVDIGGPAIAVDVGWAHSCAVRADQILVCWGTAAAGLVPPPIDVVSVSAGYYGTCAAYATGETRCIHGNARGEAGIGRTGSSGSTPVLGIEQWEGVSFAGYGGTVNVGRVCAWNSEGAACWGEDQYGGLGLGVIADYARSPKAVPIGAGWGSVALGYWHACGRDLAGQSWCWGSDDHGVLLNGIEGAADRPVMPSLAGTWEQLAPGASSSCGIVTDGGERRLFCWGDNSNGQLATGDKLDRTAAAEVFYDTGGGMAHATDWHSVAMKGSHACGLRDEDGVGRTLWCWGLGQSGVLGLGDTNERLVATRVGVEDDWAEVAVSSLHTCGIRQEGPYRTLWCWGFGTAAAQCAVNPVLTPTLVGSATDVWEHVYTGQQHTCGLEEGGLLSCWGSNYNGELGAGTVSNPECVPQEVEGSDWTTIALAETRSCGVRQGRMYCWGNNNAGVLATGSSESNVVSPEAVGTQTDWTAVAGGGANFCGLRGDQLFCWGMYHRGMIGDDLMFRESPVGLPVP